MYNDKLTTERYTELSDDQVTELWDNKILGKVKICFLQDGIPAHNFGTIRTFIFNKRLITTPTRFFATKISGSFCFRIVSYLKLQLQQAM